MPVNVLAHVHHLSRHVKATKHSHSLTHVMRIKPSSTRLFNTMKDDVVPYHTHGNLVGVDRVNKDNANNED
jgi:hypothetical protein